MAYRPPDELRPAQVGVLIDESADPLDVTASIVDLAVRGYLKIEEIPDTGWFSKGDWRLTRLDAEDSALQPYEKRLRNALFESGDEVLLSDLKQNFYDDLKQIQDDLYDDSVTQRWFVRRPDRTRAVGWLGSSSPSPASARWCFSPPHPRRAVLPVVIAVSSCWSPPPHAGAHGTGTPRSSRSWVRRSYHRPDRAHGVPDEEGIFAY